MVGDFSSTWQRRRLDGSAIQQKNNGGIEPEKIKAVKIKARLLVVTMNFPPPALLLYEIARVEASHASSPEIGTAHLFLAAAKFSDLDVRSFLGEEAPAECIAVARADQQAIVAAFGRAGIDAKNFRRRLRFKLHRQDEGSRIPDGEPLHRTPAARKVFDRAFELAQEQEMPAMGIHILRALCERPDDLWLAILREVGVEAAPQDAFFGEEASDSSGTTPALDHFGRDLTSLARAGNLAPVFGRRNEIVRLGQILTSARKGNAILVGAAGVGKTAVVEGLAARLAQGGLPPALEGKRLIEIPLAGVVAGASYRGQWEERLGAILDEAKATGAILFFDEIHTLLGAGGSGASDAAQIVKPVLARGEVRIIGATTPEEYARTIEKDEALARRFETVWIEEPTREAALQIVRAAAPALGEHHGVTFSEEALVAAVELSMRFLPDLRLPDKALDALDVASSSLQMQTLSFHAGNGNTPLIGRDEVAGAIARRARIPREQVVADDGARLLRLETTLQERIVGQDAAVEAVSSALKLSFSGFKTAHKPHGVFLLAGASGVGKTELAKALSDALFGEGMPLIRFDMSEYREPHSVARLLGAPPGYVGHDEGGQLSLAVRARPASVVLFDEIEKAHPDVWNLWLQIFDEGHLTDARGRRVDFCETIIVLTSNLGAHVAKPRAIGFRVGAEPANARDEFHSNVLSALKSALKPELLGRIQETLVFEPLGAEAVRQIAARALTVVGEQAQTRGVRLEWDESLLELLVREGFDDREGARAMRKAVERLVARPLAEAMLRGQVTAPGEVCRVRVAEGGVVFENSPGV